MRHAFSAVFCMSSTRDSGIRVDAGSIRLAAPELICGFEHDPLFPGDFRF